MAGQQRSTDRLAGNMPISMLLRNASGKIVLAGPAPGTLNDISYRGASISLSHIRFGQHHFFYSAYDNPTQILYLEAVVRAEPEDEADAPQEHTFSIPARPVWFNSLTEDGSKIFKIGLEFLESADSGQIRNLVRMVSGGCREGEGWWNKFAVKCCATTQDFWGRLPWGRGPDNG